jgi:hypothetical protein
LLHRQHLGSASRGVEAWSSATRPDPSIDLSPVSTSAPEHRPSVRDARYLPRHASVTASVTVRRERSTTMTEERSRIESRGLPLDLADRHPPTP